MIETKNLVATTQSTEDVLGHIFWFTVGQQMNKVDDLRQHLINSGLGEEWMPNRIRPSDAFRRATKEIETRKKTSNAKVIKNFLVREVSSDTESIQRNIVIETVDQNDKELGYETQSAIMRLDKKNGALFFETNDTEIEELCKDAEQKFYLYRDHYSSEHIRVMITKVLNSLAPTPMRRNGILYFIPDSMTQGLTNLVTFIRLLENSDADKMPVIDSSDNRVTVNKKLNNYLDHLLEQCRSSEGLRKDQLKILVENTNNAIKDYKQYKELTSSETERFEEKIMLLRSEVIDLMKQ